MPSMISLDGQFKADIYSPCNELIQSGDWAGNYITSTGLCYPLTMPFADTFRFLSLGSGKQANDLFTTGLYSGSKPLIYQTSPDPGHNFLWTTGIVSDGCGYKTTNSGVELYRAWRIPEAGGQFLDEDLHVSELMTSPNTTGMLGTTGTSYPHPVNGGKFSDPYSGITAFNRVLKDFSIPSGDFAVITYKLNFVVDSSVRTFEPFVGLNNAQGAGKTTWQKLTGKGRVLNPGIQLIKGGGGAAEEEGGAKGGESYKLKYGEPMEPSASGNMYAYFTTDNTQYRFDPFWGGAAITGLQVLKDPSNGSLHWTHTGVNIATGFPEYFHSMPDILEMVEEEGGGGGGSSSVPKHLHDLHSSSKRMDRFEKFRREGSEIPTSSNFLTEQTAGAMGNAGYNESVIVTSLNHDLAISYTGQTHHSRSRDMTRVMGWQTVNAVGDPGTPGTWIKYKSLVFCADIGETHTNSITTLTDNQVAFFDSQFGTYDSANYPSNGEYLTTINSTGAFPYGSNDGKPTFTQPSKAYPYHDNQNGLSITWKLTWSAPCGEVAGGCSDDLYKTKTACQNASKLWTDCVDP